MKKINSILKEVLGDIKPSKEDMKNITNSLNEFLKKIKVNIKKSKVNAEIFVGGSFAKKTMIKTKKYDVDVFIRFDKEYKEDISKITEKLLKGIVKTKIHGSRDYFRIKINSSFTIEVIPVKKIKNPKEAENIIDFSYSHVNYIKKKIKSDKLMDDIRIAKAFCHANNCYGAESYIKGFSGYGLELLVYNYGGFLKLLRSLAKTNNKIIIDKEKHFKNKNEILININSSKLKSPIILVDPTYKYRNALAALSEETFKKFQYASKKFLENPSLNSFKEKKIDFDKVKKTKNNIILNIKTNKQKGDIAGSKLLKFYNHLNDEIRNYFVITKSGFEYNNTKNSKVFFVARAKKEILFKGPKVKDNKNSAKFKNKHKNTFKKSGRIYSKKKINFNIKEFLKKWKTKNKKKMKEMSIIDIEIN